MPTWVALLRAVNLGSHNKVSMPKLRDALAAEGFTDVQTYVNSGNVVLGSTLRSPAKVGQAVHDVILDHFGVDTPVKTKSRKEAAGPYRTVCVLCHTSFTPQLSVIHCGFFAITSRSSRASMLSDLCPLMPAGAASALTPFTSKPAITSRT